MTTTAGGTVAMASVPGIVYIYNVPRHMSAPILRAHFAPYGTVQRIFLLPLRRVGQRQTIGKGRRCTQQRHAEGWIEFGYQCEAIRAVDRLHQHPIAIKRKSAFSDNLWCLMYMPQLSWYQLTVTLAYPRATQRATSGRRTDVRYLQDEPAVDINGNVNSWPVPM